MNGLPSALNLFSNPIIRRYRRSQMRPVRLGATIVITLVIAGFLFTLFYLPLKYRLSLTETDAARGPFIPLLIYQALILAILGTGAIGAGILRESEEGMIEYQRLTPLSPLSKVLGYLFGLPLRQYVAFGITACFSAYSIVVGQIPFRAWGPIYLILFTSTILDHLLALVTGLIIKSRWRAGLISIGLVVVINVFLPRLADFGFTMFSHLSVWPVVWGNLGDLLPQIQNSTWLRKVSAPDVPFWNLQVSHWKFALVVQGTLIVTFILMLVRRWRDEEAHLLGKAYAVAWLLWLQIILLGSILPLLEHGRVSKIMVLGGTSPWAQAFRQVSGPVEAAFLALLFGAISFVILLPMISCITPREPTQMVAFRQRKKFGRRRIPWLADGATAAPFAWLAAIITGTAWAVFMERLSTSQAYGLSGFPPAGWAIFIGIAFAMGAIFHFLLEAYSRRVAWMTLFLAGLVPLFTSLVLISISRDWLDTVRYLSSLSPLSAPWQPLDWLLQTEFTKLPPDASQNISPNFGPFTLFCALHAALCLTLFIAWRRKRQAREARA
jgi:hypothetical protein